VNVRGPIHDLDWIAWKSRKVIIAFDPIQPLKTRFVSPELSLPNTCGGRAPWSAFLNGTSHTVKGFDDHLAAVGPEAVLSAIARVTFTAFNWREELIRAKPTAAHPQGNIYPVLANAITAIKPAPWGAISNTTAWSDHDDRLTAEWLQRKGILVDVGTAAQAAQTVSKDRSFHPVRKYLESIA
jgi:hypothetical protein